MSDSSLHDFIKEILVNSEYIPVPFIKSIKFEFFDGKCITMPGSCFTQKYLKKEGKILSLNAEHAIKDFCIFVDIDLVVMYIKYITLFSEPTILKLPKK